MAETLPSRASSVGSAVRQLRHLAYRLTHSRLKGFSLRLNFPDRVFLEDQIFPWLLSLPDRPRILFVGCDWYTKDYPTIFASREFCTIEIDPAKARFGSARHAVDSLENLSKHFAAEHFDVIVHTGVFGWGINSREMTEQTFEQCHRCLKPGGLLVFGWDDVPQYRSFPVIEECQALKRFVPIEFPPLGKHQVLTADNELRHTFNFYCKRDR